MALLFLCAAIPGLTRAEPAATEVEVTSDDYLLHMPGIAGYHWVDRQLLAGLREGGWRGEVDVRDWPGNDPGLAALLARKRNREEAQAVADAIEARRRAHPQARIVLTAHSGGNAILVWALEKLPKDVKVDTVLMLAPALSPAYDLSKALTHVRGHAYAFTSTLDGIVLGTGTSTFGTMDGVKCDAAGRGGFVVPETADEKAYEKLLLVPYEAKWMRLGNLGDHIGPLSRQFARGVLAPLVAGVGQDEAGPLIEGQRAAKAKGAAKGEGTGERKGPADADPAADVNDPPDPGSSAKGQAPSDAARRSRGLASSREKHAPVTASAPPGPSHAP